MSDQLEFSPILLTTLGAAVIVGYLMGTRSRQKPSSSSSSSQGSAKLKLSYYSGRGLAEVARQMLVIAGTEFEDDRRSSAGGEIENLGRLPLLHVTQPDGTVVRIGQSSAIFNFVAKQIGFLGTNDIEVAQIQMLCAHIKDMKDSFQKVCPYGQDPMDGWEKKWFDSPKEATDRADRCLKWYLARIEPLVGADGFAVGGRHSLADAVFYNLLGETCTDLPETLYHGKSSVCGQMPFGAANYERTQNVMKEVSPKILKIVENFRDNPNLQEYLKTRGPQQF